MAAKIRIPIEVEIHNLQDIPKLEDKLKEFGSIAQTATEAARKYTQEDQIRWAQYQRAVTTALKGAAAAQKEYIDNLKRMASTSAKMTLLDENGESTGRTKLTNQAEYQREINRAILEYGRLMDNVNEKSSEAHRRLTEFWKTFGGRTEMISKLSGEMAGLEEKISLVTSKMIELAESGNKDGKEMDKLASALSKYQSQLEALQRTSAEEAFVDFNRTIDEQADFFKNTGRELEGLQKKYQALNSQILKNIQSGDVEHNEELQASLSQVSARIDELNNRNQVLNFERLKEMAQVLENLGENSEATRLRSKALKDEIIRLSQDAKNNEERIRDLTNEYKNLNQTASGMKAWAQNFGSLITYVLKYRIALALVRDTWRKITTTIKESMDAAASAEQVYNKLNTVFKNYNASLSEAISLSNKLGTAATTAASAISTIGDMLQGQGMGANQSLKFSSMWTSQLADIIAFKDLNMTLDEFASSFMAGSAGNTRNFRQFGSVVKEVAVEARLAADGLSDLTGEELELAKMVTRATLALEQQANSEGAVAREWNTVLSVNRRISESWKEWKENIGEVINAGLNPFKRALAEILESANNVKKIRDALKNEQKISNSFDLSNPRDESLMADMFSIKTNVNWGAAVLGSRNSSTMEYPAQSIDELVKKLYTLSATYKDLEDYFEKSGQPGLTNWLHNLATADEVTERMKEYSKYADAPEKFAYAWNDATDAMQRAGDQLDTINSILKGFSSVGEYALGNDFTDKDSIEHIIGLTHVGTEGNEEAALKDMVDMYSKLQTAISKTRKEQENMTSSLADMEKEFRNRYGVSANLKSLSLRETDAEGNALSEEDYKAAREMISQIDTLRAAIDDANGDILNYEKNLTELTPIVADLYSKTLIQNVSKLGDEYDDQMKTLILEGKIRRENLDASDAEVDILVNRQKAMDELDTTYRSQLAMVSLLQDNEKALADLETARTVAEANINEYFKERIRLQKEADEAAREKERLETIKDILESALEYGDSARDNLEVLRLEQRTRAENAGLSEAELDIEIERQRALRETENEYDDLLAKLREQNASEEDIAQLESDRAASIKVQNDLYDYQLTILQKQTAEIKKQQGMLTVGSIRDEAIGRIQSRRDLAGYMSQGMSSEKAGILMNRDALLRQGYEGFRAQTSGIAGIGDALSGYDYRQGPDALFTALNKSGVEWTEELQEALYNFEDMWDAVTSDVAQQIKELDDAAASQVVQSRLSAAYSWADFKNNLSQPTTYSGPYAEVDAWADSANSELSKLLEKMFEAGYSIDELNDFRAEGIELIKEEAQARKEAIDAEKEAAKKRYIGGQLTRLAGSTVGGIVNDAKEGAQQGGVWGAILNVGLGILEKFGVLDELNAIIDETLTTVVKPLMPMVSQTASLTKSVIAPILKAIETPIKIIATVVTVVSGIIESIATAIDWGFDNIMIFFRNLGTIIYNATHWFNQRALEDYRTLADLEAAELKVAQKTEDNVYKIWHSNEEERSLDDSYVKAIQEMMAGGILTDIEGMNLIKNYLGPEVWSNTLAPMDEQGHYMHDYATGVIDNSTNTFNFTINGSGLSKEEMVEAMMEFYKRVEVTKGTPTTYIGGAFA